MIQNQYMRFYYPIVLPLYVLGILLFSFTATKPFFEMAVGTVLLISYLPHFIFHQPKESRAYLWFAFIYLTSFVIEVIGVKTGLFFGDYQYGHAMGVKLFDTPLLIGLNWLFVCYASRRLAMMITPDRWVRVFLGATLMVCFDIMLEIVAPIMSMWEFTGGSASYQNYISWFILGVIYQSGFDGFKIDIKPTYSVVLFITQFLFFIAIAVIGSYLYL